ncbi:MAG: lipocalin family protein [Pseudomonadota bacterium]
MDDLDTVEHVDLERFMGDWFVIAHIPTFIENEAYNAVERYELVEPDRVNTTFTFNHKRFDGEFKQYHPTGFVREGTGNAIWGMRFIWPFKGDFRIAYLDEDYTTTIIARNKRDYVWIMAREPVLSDQRYDALVLEVQSMGYALDNLRKVPQQALDER